MVPILFTKAIKWLSTKFQFFFLDFLIENLSDVAAEEMEEEELLLDDSLSPLEKIFLYVKSDLVFHR